MVEWKPFERNALANQNCVFCRGRGGFGIETCQCVWRAIFRAGLNQFLHVDRWCNPDFAAAVSSALDDDSLFWVFHYHFLLGASPESCMFHLNLDRGAFFHAVNQIEQLVGAELQRTGFHAARHLSVEEIVRIYMPPAVRALADKIDADMDAAIINRR